jgi:hypothetical protein
MSRVGLEPTIAVFEWAKKFSALNLAATVNGFVDIRRSIW